jgi:hypothetical protein
MILVVGCRRTPVRPDTGGHGPVFSALSSGGRGCFASGGALTVLVCSSCHALLREGTSHCPRCGPGSLALFGSELSALDPRPTSDTHALDRLGLALGRQFRVVRLIGRGGFAEVFEVVDTDLQRRLAVKVLRSDLPWSAATITRFKHEARAIARLNHPNTVPIHFVGEGEGLVYYAMAYLEGRTVAELLRAEGPLPPDHALRIVEPILDALQHAHDHGLVHRDVKPENILLESGTVRPLLVDFGIVKYLDGPAHLTEAGFIVGTPLYMSPEQALGSKSVDARADIYGMGAVLYQLLTGAPPFEGTDSQEIVGRHLREPVPSASLSREDVPPWLSSIVFRCMAKHPDDRYPTARAVSEAIRAVRAGATARAVDLVALLPRADESPTESMPAAKPGARPRPWILGAAAAALIGALLVVSGDDGRGARAGEQSYGVGTRGIVETAAASSAVPEAALVVENRLAEPIAVSVDDTSLTIPPGDRGRLALPPQTRLEASWAMVQPTAGDRVLGERVEGAIVVEQVEGEIHRVVDAEAGGQARFAPLVVNEAGRPLSVAVVGPADSLDCDCRIASGDSLRLGYYRYTDRSGLRVTDTRGWSARLGDLGDRRDPVSGQVVVRVRRADLRPPPGASSRRAKSSRPPPAERRNPLGSFLPVR